MTDSGWRTIESAPKDGARILAYAMTRSGEKIAIMRWHQPGNPKARGFWYALGTGGTREPTHWMPLPKPPESTP